jgi:hypothetical protein
VSAVWGVEFEEFKEEEAEGSRFRIQGLWFKV